MYYTHALVCPFSDAALPLYLVLFLTIKSTNSLEELCNQNQMGGKPATHSNLCNRNISKDFEMCYRKSS